MKHILFFSFLFGVFIGTIYILYDTFFQFIRIKNVRENCYQKVKMIKFKEKTVLIFICDILFFVIITPLCAIFLFGINNGVVRWYVISSSLVGYIIFKISIGKLLSMIFGYLVLYTHKMFIKIFRIANKGKKQGKSPA